MINLTSHVADVRVGAKPGVSVTPGMAVGVGRQVFRLRLDEHEEVLTSKHGQATLTWNTLVAVDGAGKAHTWLDQKPDLQAPEDAEDGGINEWDATHQASIVGINGPYVSLLLGRGGYAGGAHGFDDSDAISLAAPDGRAVDVAALIGPAGVAAAARWLAVAVKAREDDYDPPQATVETLKHGALVLLRDGRLRVDGLLSCCSWAENHNQFELEAPLDSVPAGLAPSVPVGGWFTLPGCGAVRVEGGKIEVRPSGKAVSSYPLDAGRQVLGVSWIDADAPALPDQRKAAAAVAPSGKPAAADRPADPKASINQGWVAFQAGDLAAAELATRQGLEGAERAKDDRLRGMALYNLGRIHEARGQRAEAMALYEASVKARPNKTVQARLEGLRTASPK